MSRFQLIKKLKTHLNTLASTPGGLLRLALYSLVPFSLLFVTCWIIVNGRAYELYKSSYRLHKNDDLVHVLSAVGIINLALVMALMYWALLLLIRKLKNASSVKIGFLWVTGLSSLLLSGFFLLKHLLAFLTYEVAFISGRPLRKRGKMHISEIEESRAWLLPRKFAIPRHEWLMAARGEHSSVAAFAKLSVELSELGCPPALLAGAHLAALDEINHAQLAFTLDAAANKRTSSGPAAHKGVLGEAGHLFRVQKMAIETFSDGCLFEARSAQHLYKRAQEEPDLVIKKEIERIWREEEGHVALAWKIVQWCFGEIKHQGQRDRLLQTLLAMLKQEEAKRTAYTDTLINDARASLQKIYLAIEASKSG